MSKKMIRYKFVYNEANVNTLGSLGFEIRPLGNLHYYWTAYSYDEQKKLNTHILCIHRTNYVLSYIGNGGETDLLAIDDLHKFVVAKIEQLKKSKLIYEVTNTTVEPKRRRIR